MPEQVIAGALLQCDKGNIPTALIVLPTNGVMAYGPPAATINDYLPLLNILPFGMCSSIMNPMVIAATIAAMGALTPMPCLPMTVSPWKPGSPTVKIAGAPALKAGCSLTCLWGGMISIKMAGQFLVQVA